MKNRINEYLTYLDSVNNCVAINGASNIKTPSTRIIPLSFDKLNSFINFKNNSQFMSHLSEDNSNISFEASNELSRVPGDFVSDETKGMYGYIVSGVDGRQHTIYKQGEITGWGGNCNRAAAASIASGFTDNPWETIKQANNIGDGIGYRSEATSAYFAKFGLSASVDRVDCRYDLVKDKIASNLEEGNFVMFDLSESHVKGKSGQTWTSSRHWVAAMDIKKIGPNDNDIAIFISDSGHSGSTVDRLGLGEGWYRLDEFDGQMIANVTIIKQEENNNYDI